MRNDLRIRAALVHARGRPCLLCDGESDYAAAWVPPPEYDEVFEQTLDERTSFGYALCASCETADDARERVEAKLIQKWGRKLNG